MQRWLKGLCGGIELIPVVLAVLSLACGSPGQIQHHGAHAAPIELSLDDDAPHPTVGLADTPKALILPPDSPRSTVDPADATALLVLTA
jgi:hypothetical protein